MDVAAHHTEQHLQRLADQEPRADRAKRLRTVLLARQGFTAPEIATPSPNIPLRHIPRHLVVLPSKM